METSSDCQQEGEDVMRQRSPGGSEVKAVVHMIEGSWILITRKADGAVEYLGRRKDQEEKEKEEGRAQLWNV